MEHPQSVQNLPAGECANNNAQKCAQIAQSPGFIQGSNSGSVTVKYSPDGSTGVNGRQR